MKKHKEYEWREIKRWPNPLPQVASEILHQLVDKQTLAAAPLGVQPHGDWEAETGLREDVTQRHAIQLVPQQVLWDAVLIGVELPPPKQLAEDGPSCSQVNVLTM